MASTPHRVSGARGSEDRGALARTSEPRRHVLGVRRPGERPRGQTPPLLPTLLGAYGVVGALAATVAVAIGRDPVATASWVGLEGGASIAWSVALGAVLAAITILTTRLFVRRARWARALHTELRPSVRGVDGVALALMALASGIAEELFFRGLLTQVVGLVISSLAFGLLHQVRGPARWAWAGWAAVMGLAFGFVFELTGSLVGPMVAHVLINTANLRYLRDTDVDGLEPPTSANASGAAG